MPFGELLCLHLRLKVFHVIACSRAKMTLPFVIGFRTRLLWGINFMAHRRPPSTANTSLSRKLFSGRMTPKGPRAANMRRSVSTHPKSQATGASTSSSVPLVVALLFVLFVIAGTLTGRLPLAVIAAYGVVSILTFLVYWFDKSAARHGQWRTKESTLHLLGLAGGWPGAVVAQRVLRHKSRKQQFQVAFWGTVVMNSIALGWLATNSGSKFLHQLLK